MSAYTLEPAKQIVETTIATTAKVEKPIDEISDKEMAKMICRRENPEACVMCSG